MILFHTSDRIIKKPDIHIGRSNADFGRGFYLTPDESFAGNWARERTASDIYVNKYELCTEGLRIRELSKDTEWYEYISGNRRGAKDLLADHDAIIGPIASDTLFETYGIITSGLLTADQALQLLDIGPEYTQVAIKTERGAAALNWLEARILDRNQLENAKSQYTDAKAKFDEEFAAALDKMI